MNIDLDETRDGHQEPNSPHQVQVPFLREAVGAGDAGKRLTSALGVKPCSPCAERARKMNERVQFVPMGWS